MFLSWFNSHSRSHISSNKFLLWPVISTGIFHICMSAFNMIFLFDFSWEFDTWRQFGLSDARLSFAWNIKLFFFPISRLFIHLLILAQLHFAQIKKFIVCFPCILFYLFRYIFFLNCQFKGYMHFGLFVGCNFLCIKIILFGYNFFFRKQNAMNYDNRLEMIKIYFMEYALTLMNQMISCILWCVSRGFNFISFAV